MESIEDCAINSSLWYFYFVTFIVFFKVFMPFTLAEIVAFPAFLAVILPLELMESTEGLEELQVTPFKIFAFVVLIPPIIPGYATLQDTDRVFVFFTLMEDGALKESFCTFFLLTSIVWTYLPFTLDWLWEFALLLNSPATPYQPPVLRTKEPRPIYL